MQYVLVLNDSTLPGDSQIYGTNLDHLKAEAEENVAVDPLHIRARIFRVFGTGTLGKAKLVWSKL
jgi:hypothetical protein